MEHVASLNLACKPNGSRRVEPSGRQNMDSGTKTLAYRSRIAAWILIASYERPTAAAAHTRMVRGHSEQTTAWVLARLSEQLNSYIIM